MTELKSIEQSARVRELHQQVEDLTRVNAALKHGIETYHDEILEVEAAGFILRLKWLFTGINK